MSSEREYVLGTHDAELDRLGLQHRVWRPHALAAWQRAGFTIGQTILDVGCGPGYAALDLAELVGPTGRVIGIDRSRRFLDALDAAARSRGLTWLRTLELDLDRDEWPGVQADGAWSRWVYAFVREPRRLLERTRAAVRPGGMVVLHEYLDYRTWRLSPRRERFEAFVLEVMASWRESGGEPDVGHDLPRWLEELGFEIRSVTPRVEIARPGDPWWAWPSAFVDVGLQRLVALGRVSEADARAVVDDYAGIGATPGAFQVMPMVVEVIAVRR